MTEINYCLNPGLKFEKKRKTSENRNKCSSSEKLAQCGYTHVKHIRSWLWKQDWMWAWNLGTHKNGFGQKVTPAINLWSAPSVTCKYAKICQLDAYGSRSRFIILPSNSLRVVDEARSNDVLQSSCLLFFDSFHPLPLSRPPSPVPPLPASCLWSPKPVLLDHLQSGGLNLSELGNNWN